MWGEIRATVKAIEAVAEDRWGDVPKTRNVRVWDDGDFQVGVFHTFHRSEECGVCRVRMEEMGGSVVEFIEADDTPRVVTASFLLRR